MEQRENSDLRPLGTGPLRLLLAWYGTVPYRDVQKIPGK